MADYASFQPMGPTVLVGVTAVQVPISSNYGSGRSFRIRCLVAAYLTWGNSQNVSAAGAPTAGNPVTGTVGMFVSSVETFTLPANSWFISNVAASFEVTPGEGI